MHHGTYVPLQTTTVEAIEAHIRDVFYGSSPHSVFSLPECVSHSEPSMACVLDVDETIATVSDVPSGRLRLRQQLTGSAHTIHVDDGLCNCMSRVFTEHPNLRIFFVTAAAEELAEETVAIIRQCIPALDNDEVWDAGRCTLYSMPAATIPPKMIASCRGEQHSDECWTCRFKRNTIAVIEACFTVVLIAGDSAWDHHPPAALDQCVCEFNKSRLAEAPGKGRPMQLNTSPHALARRDAQTLRLWLPSPPSGAASDDP